LCVMNKRMREEALIRGEDELHVESVGGQVKESDKHAGAILFVFCYGRRQSL